MKLAVTDANIFIDLIKLQLIGFLFNIELEIHTSQEIVDQLTDSQSQVLQQFIDAGVLHATLFTADEIIQIQEMKASRALEFADKTVFFLAKKINATILTGDGALRKFCVANKFQVNGIVWLFDEFEARKLITGKIAAEKMKQLMSFNDRLPKAECEERLKRWDEIDC